MKKIFVILVSAAICYIFLNPYYLFPDGQGYFSYLSSLFYDRDLQFFNDFVNMRIPAPLALTDTGYISNNWPFGAAFFLTPFYLIAKAFADPSFSPYSKWFWYWVNFGTMLYGVLAVLLLRGLNLYEREKESGKGAAVTAALLGTPAFFYFFLIPSNAIGVTAFVSTLFIWYWFKSMKEPDRAERYILLGLILGAGAMVRQQEALFALAPLSEAAIRLIRREAKPGTVVRNLLLFAVSFVAAFSPQMLIWKTVNGSYLAAPSKFNLSWKYFALDKTLFSPYHGLLFWTPVYFTAFAGLVLGALKRPVVYIGLALVFLAQLVTNSCIVAYWEGYSFGLRQMTSLLPVIFLGTYEVLAYCRGKSAAARAIGITLVAAPVLWTTGLTVANFFGLDMLNPVSAGDILAAQKTALLNLFALPGKIYWNPRPGFGSFIVMALAGLTIAWLLALLKNAAEKRRFKPVIGILLAIIAAFNIIIMKAAANKPAYQIPKEQTVTQQQLDDFFVGQVEGIKRKMTNDKAQMTK